MKNVQRLSDSPIKQPTECTRPSGGPIGENSPLLSRCTRRRVWAFVGARRAEEASRNMGS